MNFFSRWLLLVSLLGAAGCGGGSSSPGGAAPTRSVVVYTALEDDELPDYVARWQKAHPDIELKIVRDSTGIIAARLLAEKDAPVADVLWGTALSPLYACAEAGLFEGYAPAGLDRIPATYRDSEQPPRWVGVKVWMNVLACNTIELARLQRPLPTGWDDLTDPRYAGLITVPNPASSGTGYALVASLLQMRGEAEGWAYLDRLHANVAHYTHSGSKPSKLAATGEFPIGITLDSRLTKQRSKGEPLAAVFPSGGTGWEVEVNALIRKPAIKPEARLFMDWALSADAFAGYARSNRLLTDPTAVTAINDPAYPADTAALLAKNIDWAWAARERQRILAEWTRRYGGKSEPKG